MTQIEQTIPETFETHLAAINAARIDRDRARNLQRQNDGTEATSRAALERARAAHNNAVSEVTQLKNQLAITPEPERRGVADRLTTARIAKTEREKALDAAGTAHEEAVASKSEADKAQSEAQLTLDQARTALAGWISAEMGKLYAPLSNQVLASAIPHVTFAAAKDQHEIPTEFAIGNVEIANRVHDFAEMLTARRIAEEMDESSYIRQLRATVARLVNTMNLSKDRISAQSANTGEGWYARASHHVTETTETIDGWINAARGALTNGQVAGLRTARNRDVADAKEKLAGLRRNLNAIGARLERSVAALEDPKSMGDLYKDVRKIARDVERASGRRWLPLFVSGVTVALVAGILHHPASIVPLSRAEEVMALVGAGSFALVAWAAGKQRTRAMAGHQSDQITRLAGLLHLSWDPGEPPIPALKSAADWSDQDRVVDRPKPGIIPTSLFRLAKWVPPVAAASALVAFLAATADTGRDGGSGANRTALVSLTASGERCVLGQGRYLDFVDGHHLVAADDAPPWQAWVFPRAHGQRFAASEAVAVLPARATHEMTPCTGTPSRTESLTSITVAAPIVTVQAAPPTAPCQPPRSCTALPDILQQVQDNRSGISTAVTLLEEIKTAGTAPAQVVTVLPRQEVAKAEWAGSFTHVIVMDDAPPIRLRNEFLIFTPGVIRNTDNTRALAFRKGLDSIPADFDGPTGTTAVQIQLAQLLDRVNNHAGRPDGINLVVDGFASDEWGDLAPDDPRTKELNHALAEGRRAGVLRFLAREAADDLAKRIVVSTGGACPLLSAWANVPDWEDYKLRRFTDPSEMTLYRQQWAATELPETPSDALNRQMQRVVRVGFRARTTCEA